MLVGGRPATGATLATLVPGVGLVAVNPPAGVADEDGISVIRGGRLPLKTRSMRGVVLGAPFGGDPAWVREAARVVLPGLRVVGEGPDPAPEAIELMASAGGVWVGTPPARVGHAGSERLVRLRRRAPRWPPGGAPPPSAAAL